LDSQLCFVSGHAFPNHAIKLIDSKRASAPVVSWMLQAEKPYRDANLV